MADISRGEKAKKFLKVFLIIIGAIAAILLLGLPITSMPSFCGSCHEMKDIYTGWHESTHQRVSCTGCHVEPGTINYVSAKFAAAHNIIAHITEIYPHPIRIKHPISNAACIKCHSANRVISPGGDLIIPHQHHVEQLQMPCSRCHRNLHLAIAAEAGGSASTGAPYYHKICWGCHNGIQATNKCTACHTKKAVPKNHLATDFGTTHGELSKTEDCAKCHGYTKDFCVDCHKKRPSTHVLATNWKGEHGAIARNRLTNCMACHTPESGFCQRCHD